MPIEFVIAGLGNPGDRYRHTRHNLGFRVVEVIARSRGARWGAPFRRRRRTARCNMAGREVLLVEPLTFMNLSGEALEPLLVQEGLAPDRLLVVCDDVALALGRIRLRRGGSDGGHNGLKSVAERLDSTAFPRLRLGIGPVPPRVDAAEFVLAEFLPEEIEAVEEMVAEAASCADAWISLGIERAMNRFNVRGAPQDPSPEP